MIFEWPALLWSLWLLPVLLLLYAASLRRRRRYTVRFTNLALLREVAGRRPVLRRHLPPALFLVGLAALLISLARPHTVVALPLDHSGVILAMDISSSMESESLTPTRMEAAKQAALAFLDSLPAPVRVGVVAFNRQASVRVPLTNDLEAVRRAIEGLEPSGGTALGDGLIRAVEQFGPALPADGTQRGPAMVVLLSDGRNRMGEASPDQAAARARQAGVTVHAIGVGGREGTGPETMQGIARVTGGQYFHVERSEELRRVYAGLGAQVYWVEERTDVSPLFGGIGASLLAIGGILGLRWAQQLPY